MKDNKEWLQMVEHIEKIDHQSYVGYYNGYRLLKMSGLENVPPEIFICAGNRTGGKSFFFKRFLTLLNKEYNTQFLWVTRKITQVIGCSRSFYEDICHCDDIGTEWEIEVYARNVKSLSYNGNIVGYFTYLNYATDLKELSNMFNCVDVIVKDEFQSEVNEYVEDEMIKIRSIHKSVSRGYGQKTRYCPNIWIGNQTSIINPYYVSLGIHKRLRPDTHYMRGKGYALEVFFNEEASRKSRESAFETAFGEDEYSQSANQNIFLDNTSFIKRMDTSKMRPQFSIGVLKQWYSVWHAGTCFYVSTQKITRGTRFAIDVDSHTDNSILLRRSDPVFRSMKEYFDKGRFYFENLEAKNACASLFMLTII